MMDIESSDFNWSSLSSLHHTKHTDTSTEPYEDDTSRSFEVYCFHLYLLQIMFCIVGKCCQY